MYLWIVRLLTLTPSLSSSPRILSAPQSLFADAIDRTSATVSGTRRDAGRVRLRQRQRALEAGAVSAKKRLGFDDAQHIPPGRRDGSERDQGDPVQPRHARPGDRALQHGELVSEQRDLREQRPTRAKDVRHGGDEHEHGLEHGRPR